MAGLISLGALALLITVIVALVGSPIPNTAADLAELRRQREDR